MQRRRRRREIGAAAGAAGGGGTGRPGAPAGRKYPARRRRTVPGAGDAARRVLAPRVRAGSSPWLSPPGRDRGCSPWVGGPRVEPGATRGSDSPSRPDLRGCRRTAGPPARRQVRRSARPRPSGHRRPPVRRGHLALWLAGRLTLPSDASAGAVAGRLGAVAAGCRTGAGGRPRRRVHDGLGGGAVEALLERDTAVRAGRAVHQASPRTLRPPRAPGCGSCTAPRVPAFPLSHELSGYDPGRRARPAADVRAGGGAGERGTSTTWTRRPPRWPRSGRPWRTLEPRPSAGRRTVTGKQRRPASVACGRCNRNYGGAGVDVPQSVGGHEVAHAGRRGDQRKLAPGTIPRIVDFARPYRRQIVVFLILVVLDAMLDRGAAADVQGDRRRAVAGWRREQVGRHRGRARWSRAGGRGRRPDPAGSATFSSQDRRGADLRPADPRSSATSSGCRWRSSPAPRPVRWSAGSTPT